MPGLTKKAHSKIVKRKMTIFEKFRYEIIPMYLLALVLSALFWHAGGTVVGIITLLTTFTISTVLSIALLIVDYEYEYWSL